VLRSRSFGRAVKGIALLLLAYTPFVLIGGNEAYANQIAMGASLEAHTPPRLARLVYAYYFLVIGVVQQFAEYIRENKR